ncbi:hypothetical protein ACLOJK_004423 [Asimina triloba]
MQQRLKTGSKHVTSGRDLHLHVRPAIPHPSPFDHDIKVAMEPKLRSSSSKGHTPPAARSSHASFRHRTRPATQSDHDPAHLPPDPADGEYNSHARTAVGHHSDHQFSSGRKTESASIQTEIRQMRQADPPKRPFKQQDYPAQHASCSTS